MRLILLWLLGVVPVMADTVGFKWRAVEKDSVGYRLYWGPQSHTYTNMVQINWLYQTNCVIDVSGEQYFALTSFGPGGESDFSNEMVWRGPLRLAIITERSTNATQWVPVTTNEITTQEPLGLYRLRVERK